MGKMNEQLIEDSVSLSSEDLLLMGYSRSDSENLRNAGGMNNSYDISKREELYQYDLTSLINTFERLRDENGNCDVLFCGQDFSYIHVTKDQMVLNIDISDLDEYYDCI